MDAFDQSGHIVRLLRRFLDDTLNEGDAELLDEWANAHPDNRVLLDRLTNESFLVEDLQLYWTLWNDTDAAAREQRILSKVKRPLPRPKNKRMKPVIYACSMMLILGLFFIYKGSWNSSTQTQIISAADVLPGGNRATLSLADGRRLELNAEQSGIVVGQEITYLDGSSLLAEKKPKDSPPQMLVLQTPMGGNYQVILPDSSKVWLNANSTLRYPDHFSDTSRTVYLSGEAYFEIQDQWHQGNKVPFKVQSNGQTVQVLGTKFNISAYADEHSTKTTLLRGSVEVFNMNARKSNRIRPGQEAVLKGENLEVNTVDASKSIAWKDGRFSFDGKSFDQIMREMARWYNLEVEYQGAVPADLFIGDAFKTDKLETVLRFLESSDIQYHVEAGKHNQYTLIIHDSSKGKEAVR